MPVITYLADPAIGSITQLVIDMRRAGIPVRIGPDDTVRLCPEYYGEMNLGKGVLTRHEEFGVGSRIRFTYERPANPHVIDVEARVVDDVPRLK